MSFYNNPQGENPQVTPEGTPAGYQKVAPDTSNQTYLGDSIQGVGHGLQEGLQSIYNLGSLTGAYKKRDFDLIQAPDLLPGQMLSSVAQFGTGFIPGLGVAGKLNKIGKGTGMGAKLARGAEVVVSPKALGKLRKPGSKLDPLGLGSIEFIGGAMAQDALVTALAFESGAGTMVDALDQFGLAPQALEFLGSDESDSEAEGRFKQSLEAGMTVPVFTVLGGAAMVGAAKAFRKYFSKVNALELGDDAARMDVASPEFAETKKAFAKGEDASNKLREANARALREAAGDAQADLDVAVLDAVAEQGNLTSLTDALRPLLGEGEQGKLDAFSRNLDSTLARYRDARATAIREGGDPGGLKGQAARDAKLMIDEVAEGIFGDGGLLDMPLMSRRDSIEFMQVDAKVKRLELVLLKEGDSLPKLKKRNLQARLKELQAERKAVTGSQSERRMDTLAHIGSVGEYAIGRTIVDNVPRLEAAVAAGDVGAIRAALGEINSSLAARETMAVLKSSDQMNLMRLRAEDDLARQSRDVYEQAIKDAGGGANADKLLKQWEADNMRPAAARRETDIALEDGIGSVFSGDGLRNLGIDMDDMLDGVETMTTDQLRDLDDYLWTMKQIAGKDDPVEAMRELSKWQRSTLGGKVTHLAAEGKMNGVLSIGGTISQAIVGNATTFGLRPLQNMLMRLPGINKMFSGDLRKTIQKGINLSTAGHVETMTDVGESLNMLHRAFSDKGGPKAFLSAAGRRDVSSSLELAMQGGLADSRSFVSRGLSRMLRQSTREVQLPTKLGRAVGPVSTSGGGMLQAPMKGLERIDNMFRVSTGYFGLRNRIQKQLMENGMDMDVAFKKADMQAQATLKNQMGVLAEGDTMAKSLRRRAGMGEVDPRIARGVESPYAGMNMHEIDQLRDQIGKEASRVERNLFTAPLLDSQGKQLPDATIVQRMGGWVTQSAGGHPLMRLMVPFVKVSTNAINSLAYNPTVGGAAAVANLIGTKRIFKLSDPGTLAELRKSQLSMLRRLGSSDPEVVAAAATHMAVAVPVTVGTIGLGLGTLTDDKGRPRITGKPPTDKMVATTWRELGIMPYSIWDGSKYVQYNRVEGLGPTLGVMIDVSNTLHDLQDAMSNDDSAMEIGTELVSNVYTTVAENLSKGVGMESLEALTRLVAGSAGPERAMEQIKREFVSSIPLGGTVNDIQGFGSAIFGDGEIAEVDSLLSRVSARFGADTDGVKRDLLGRPITRKGLDAGAGSYAMRVRSVQTSDPQIAREMATHMSVYKKMSSTYKGMLDLTDPEYVRNGQSAWDRAQELSSTVKISGRDLRSALRKEISSSSYQKLDPLGSDFGPSPRAERLRAIMQRYRQKALTQLSREIPELKRDARKAERNETRRARGLTLLP